MNDPFQTLGVSPSSTEDEIKSAYRKLAKKYHPDLHPDSTTAEAKMKEINEAYSECMKIKKGGGTYQQSQGGYSNPYNRQSQNGNPFSGSYDDDFNPFGGFGFGGFGGFSGNQRSGTSSSQHYDNPELQAACDYIDTGRFQEAINLLNRVPSHDAQWHALFARANIGLGNRVAALNSARQAVAMDPDNLEYRRLLEQIEYTSNSYQRAGSSYGFPSSLCQNPCVTCCLINTVCNCCCGNRCGRFYWC